MPDEIKVETVPRDLLQRMQRYPQELEKKMRQGMDESLDVVQSKQPPYPPRPVGSRYIRNGRLGGSLGGSMSGAGGGRPDIRENRHLGAHGRIGVYGSTVPYARYVIGTRTQAWMHQGRWWVMDTIRRRAEPAVIKVWEKVTERMARFLDGRG